MHHIFNIQFFRSFKQRLETRIVNHQLPRDLFDRIDAKVKAIVGSAVVQILLDEEWEAPNHSISIATDRTLFQDRKKDGFYEFAEDMEEALKSLGITDPCLELSPGICTTELGRTICYAVTTPPATADQGRMLTLTVCPAEVNNPDDFVNRSWLSASKCWFDGRTLFVRDIQSIMDRLSTFDNNNGNFGTAMVVKTFQRHGFTVIPVTV